MLRPFSTLGAVLSLGTLSACNDTNGNFVHVAPTAVVRFVNATDAPISVLISGALDTLNANLPFGAQSSCLLVNLNSTTPITFTNGLTHVTITLQSTPPLIVGGNFTIIAFANLNGVVQFATLSNSFAPTNGFAGVRFFNAAPTSGTVAMFGNALQLTPGISFGGNSDFFSLAPTPVDITFRNTARTILDAGIMTFLPGQNATAILGSPAPTTTSPFRFFTTVGC
jgi:hypothetical protein